MPRMWLNAGNPPKFRVFRVFHRTRTGTNLMPNKQPASFCWSRQRRVRTLMISDEIRWQGSPRSVYTRSTKKFYVWKSLGSNVNGVTAVIVTLALSEWRWLISTFAIGRACDRYDDGRNHENEFGAFIEPRISERLCVGFAQGPIVRQLAKRYVVNWNIIWNSVLYHGLRRQQVGVSDVYAFLQCSERWHRRTIRHWAPSGIPAAAVRKPVPSIEVASAAQTR